MIRMTFLPYFAADFLYQVYNILFCPDAQPLSFSRERFLRVLKRDHCRVFDNDTPVFFNKNNLIAVFYAEPVTDSNGYRYLSAHCDFRKFH